MSYDLMVFDPTAVPLERAEFLNWYDEQTQWSEPHGYDDPAVSTPRLRAWFLEMIKQFPPMNGPYATDDLPDDESSATELQRRDVGRVCLVCMVQSRGGLRNDVSPCPGKRVGVL